MEQLNIEKAFRELCSERSEYLEYYHIYFATKFILTKDYYPFIKDKLPYYTDHGENHIKRVLEILCQLLKGHLPGEDVVRPQVLPSLSGDLTSPKLNVLEMYLLLCSVLWHDIGNLYGRIDHEKNISNYFNKAKDFLFDRFSSEWIVKIGMSHSSPNTIEGTIDIETRNERRHPFFPRFTAALLRLADELDETKERIGQRVMGDIPEENQVFWFFCNCNDSIDIKPQANGAGSKIVIESKINISDIHKEFVKINKDGTETKVFGMQEYLQRISKINKERLYCSSFLRPHYFRPPAEVISNVRVYDNEEFLEQVEIRLTDRDCGVDVYETHKNKFEKYKGEN